MKIGGFLSKPLFVPVSLAVVIGLGMVTPTVQAAEGAKKIEIVIKDGTAKVVSGYTVAGSPAEIIVRNEDTMTHGFNSSLWGKNEKVELVTGGYRAEGKGPNVFRVDPGKTMVLKFTKHSQEGTDSTTYSFWCDMHRSVKGEMLVVELTGEGGG